MRKPYSLTIIAAMVALFATSCKSDVNFSDIDKTAEVDMALALPVGTMSATINDFIGSESVQEHLVVNEDGVLQLNYDYDISRPYTSIELKDYMADYNQSTAIKSQTGAVINGTGSDLSPIIIPVELTLDGCNTAEKIEDFGRIDSILVSDAKFTTTITLDSWNLKKEYISKVRLVLKDGFNRSAGNSFELNFSNFGSAMEIDVKDFYASLVKDKSLVPTTKAQADLNVDNKLSVEIQLVLNIPSGEHVDVNDNSKVNVVMHTDLLEYDAIWGYFIPSNKMREQGTEDIASDLDNWSKLKKCTLMLAKPRIDLWATTEIVAPLVIRVNELSVTSTISGQTEKAQFAEGDHTTWHYITTDTYHTQFKTEPGKTYTAPYYLTEDPTQGDLARLFRVRPDILNYDFNIEVDTDNRHLQHRITPNSNIDLTAKMHIPLSFNKGMELNYRDTLDDVEISLNLDSIINEVEVVDSLKATDIKLRILAESTIPLDVKVGYSFLDEFDQEISFKNLVENDTIIINAPTELIQGVVNPDKPGKTELIVNVSKEEFDKLDKVKKIVYDAFLMTNNESFDNNPGTRYVSLLPSSGLKVNIAASASLEAILDLNFDDDKK